MRPLALAPEMHHDASDAWQTLENWTLEIKPWEWGAMVDGMAVPAHAESHVDTGPPVHPSDLYDRVPTMKLPRPS